MIKNISYLFDFSGTYNNQWMVVDYKKLAMEEIPTEGVLTVLEQIPDLVVIEDQTKLLLTRGYWKSYNRAFYPGTIQILRNQRGGWVRLNTYICLQGG